MEGTDGFDIKQRFQSSLGPSSSLLPKQINQLEIPLFDTSEFGVSIRQLSQNVSPENSKKPGIPPSHPTSSHASPYSLSRASSQQQVSENFSPKPFDCLPPLSPLSHHEPSINLPIDSISLGLLGGNRFQTRERILLCKGHRRSNSDVPMGFSTFIKSSPQLMPIMGQGVLNQAVQQNNFGAEKKIQSVKQELDWNQDSKSISEGMVERKSEGEVVDEMFTEYMNLDNIDTLNSSDTEDKDLDSRMSGTKPNGVDNSDNEAESCINGNSNNINGKQLIFTTEKKEGVKRSAGRDIAPTAGHVRSVSMDSFMGNLNFSHELIKLPPSTGSQVSQQHSPSKSMDRNITQFSLDLANSEFTEAELKKIMVNEKLTEIALSDPKRAKRILANRQSAARSKERKMRYISDLERKLHILQTKATTLSAQFTMLQRDSAGLTSQNKELKFRLQAMEQQAQLREALNEALAAEVQHLKATTEPRGNSQLSDHMSQQLSVNHQTFHRQL